MGLKKWESFMQNLSQEHINIRALQKITFFIFYAKSNLFQMQ